jgi:putative endonuclease
MKRKPGFVYIITNSRHSVLYVGATDNLAARVLEHRTKVYRGSFSAKYELGKLVHYEAFEEIQDAFDREQQIKSWSRKKKVNLVDRLNPLWADLYYEIAATNASQEKIATSRC